MKISCQLVDHTNAQSIISKVFLFLLTVVYILH